MTSSACESTRTHSSPTSIQPQMGVSRRYENRAEVKAHIKEGRRARNNAAWIWPFSPEMEEGFPSFPSMSLNNEQRREVVKKQPSWQFVGRERKGESFSDVLSLRSREGGRLREGGCVGRKEGRKEGRQAGEGDYISQLCSSHGSKNQCQVREWHPRFLISFRKLETSTRRPCFCPRLFMIASCLRLEFHRTYGENLRCRVWYTVLLLVEQHTIFRVLF